MEQKGNRFFNDTKFAISAGIAGALVVFVCLAVFLIAVTLKTLDNNGVYPSNVVSINGEGEVFAIPDIASFSYTVSEVSEDVESAQKIATEKNNKILALLKENVIEEKDIKTLSYNIYPKYEWRNTACIPGTICRGGENVLIGQEVNQTIQVKVRDTEKAGNILSLVGKENVSNVSGLNFSIDDEDVLKDEARALAIEDAKSKAEKLAKQLDVKLKRVISFSEDQGDYGYQYGGEMMKSSVMMDGGFSATPELPAGENRISSRVYITFEIN
jgi:uncharacterized protein YggE